MVLLVRLDLQVILDLQVLLGQLEQLDRRVLESLDLRGLLGLLVPMVLQGLLDLRGQLGLLERLVILEPMALLDLREPLELLDLRVQLGLRVRPDLLVRLA